MKGLSIGKGENMSIAKAALIFYYEHKGGQGILNYGQLDDMHEIVTIAGATQQGFYTTSQVISRLSASPYWEGKFIKGFYAGLRGHGGATVLKPSEKGREYYQNTLKDRKMSNKEFVKSKMPKAKAESQRKNGGGTYWLIRDGNSYMYFAEGNTQAQAWKNAADKLKEQDQ